MLGDFPPPASGGRGPRVIYEVPYGAVPHRVKRRISGGVQPVSRCPEVHVVEPIAPGTVGLCWVEAPFRDFAVEFTDDGQAQVTAPNGWGWRRDGSAKAADVTEVAEAAELAEATLRESGEGGLHDQPYKPVDIDSAPAPGVYEASCLGIRVIRRAPSIYSLMSTRLEAVDGGKSTRIWALLDEPDPSVRVPITVWRWPLRLDDFTLVDGSRMRAVGVFQELRGGGSMVVRVGLDADR